MSEDPEKLKEMLTYSGGKMEVPVIVEGDKVTVGFAGDVSLRGGIPLWGDLTGEKGLSVRDHKQKRYQGGSMFEVTEKAGSMIKEFLEKQKTPHTIRILLQAG